MGPVDRKKERIMWEMSLLALTCLSIASTLIGEIVVCETIALLPIVKRGEIASKFCEETIPFLVIVEVLTAP